jgi:hypothetical protein
VEWSEVKVWLMGEGMRASCEEVQGHVGKGPVRLNERESNTVQVATTKCTGAGDWGADRMGKGGKWNCAPWVGVCWWDR